MPVNRRVYGWLPDVPDQRDMLYMKFAKKLKAPARLPNKIDLRNICPAVEDQGELGSCTAQALVGNIELLQLKKNKPLTDLSRLFLYYNERVREHTVNEDSGAMIRTGIKSLVKEGICHESIWPYNIGKYTSKPPAQAYSNAALHQITSYYRLLGLIDMQQCLASGYPFVFGVAVYDSFMTDAVAKTGTVPSPRVGETMLGGHAMLCVGYSMSTRRFIVRNSWGINWGEKGYCTIPFTYLGNRNLSDDFWTVRGGEEL